MKGSLGKYIGLCSVFLTAVSAQQPTETAKPAANQVVFVCEHGAAKSLIAATYFNRLAEKRGLPQRAVARGTHPDAAYSPSTVNGLKADGVSGEKGKPARVIESDIQSAERVVTLGCKLPASLRAPAKLDEWEGIPAVSENYPAARDAIKKHVEELLDELSARKNQ